MTNQYNIIIFVIVFVFPPFVLCTKMQQLLVQQVVYYLQALQTTLHYAGTKTLDTRMYSSGGHLQQYEKRKK